VRRRYSDGYALDVPSLDVVAGEVLAVIGPNGAGKSTLLRILGLLERPDAGQVLLHGRTVDARHALAERRHMATVFQEPLLADATVADNAALGLRFRGLPAADRTARVQGWLERLGIAGLASRAARTLSGGEAQRVALARALVLEPEVLLLDEPFSGLDAPTRATLVTDLGAILRGDRVTTVLVTHERGEAQALADRVGVLMDGHLRQLDETARVFYAPVSEDVARFVGVETLVAGRVLSCNAGVTAVEVGGLVLEVAAAAAAGARVRVAIRPEDVTLMIADGAPVATSARNALVGTVTAVNASTHATHVIVDVGFPLVAAVTARSARDLGLRPGSPVRAVFKASAAHLIPADADDSGVARAAGPLDSPGARRYKEGTRNQ
jgi:tungstate transport system ATP-binding protein